MADQPEDRRRVRFGGEQTSSGFVFELTGGRLCLDLANTLDERETDRPRELLETPDGLLQWAAQAGALPDAEAAGLRRHLARHRRLAAAALARVLELRECIFDIFSATAGRQAVRAESLELLNRVLSRAAARRRLQRQGSRAAWTWRSDGPDPDAVLWRAAWSAAELLTSPEADRVRQCAGAGCAWLFLDTSKNRTRRWCDMTVCGNRTKARRHYEKIRAGG